MTASPNILFRQTDPVTLTGPGVDTDAEDHVITVDINQPRATALRIWAEVQTHRVTGPANGNFILLTNIHYDKTPVFWDTILYPDTGTHLWQRYERYVRPRLPIKQLEIRFRMTRTSGTAEVRNFTAEAVEPFSEDNDLTVALLGDSTDMGAYIPDAYKMNRQLEMLLQDRFADTPLAVRNLAESGDYLEKFLTSGRIERELATLDTCDMAVIRYGINDNGHGIKPETFTEQLHDTCDRVLAKFPNCRIVLCTTIPSIPEAMHAATRRVAGERHFPLVDVAAMLTVESVHGNFNWHTGIGHHTGYQCSENPPDNPTGLGGNQHPNIHGTRMIAEQIYHTIAPLLAEQLEGAQHS